MIAQLSWSSVAILAIVLFGFIAVVIRMYQKATTMGISDKPVRSLELV